MCEEIKKCIIWGAGNFGKKYYQKLTTCYNYIVIAYIDSNPLIQGTFINDIEVKPPDYIKNLSNEIDIIICVEKYNEICTELEQVYGFKEYFLMLGGFLFRNSQNKKMLSVHISVESFKKKRKEDFSILFVQFSACIRTHKFAYLMKKLGVDVSYLYMASDNLCNTEFLSVYTNIYIISSFSDMINFVDDSEFDVVHSSNEPDYLTALLLGTNKKIVHDTHDMLSVRDRLPIEALVMEFMANTRSSGCLYPNEIYRNLAIEKFQLAKEKTFAIENLPLESMTPSKYLPKLSAKDGELHVVYEGGISDNVESSRFFEDIWRKITNKGIHIHYYAHQSPDYCKRLSATSEYLHYEGNFSSVQLAEEMTKYDCGLVLFNLSGYGIENDKMASVLKLYEYLNAGLPIAVCDVSHFIKFVEKYEVGALLDLDGDVLTQLVNISAIKINKSFLSDNKLTLDCYAESLLEFYKAL
ncbi:MAG: hypothetical protein LBC96_10315 [Lachnospiraceae bacterium]|jgi:hypothetical protein|nr:hypothetical protein [Lachnospiraceae bacterium]